MSEIGIRPGLNEKKIRELIDLGAEGLIKIQLRYIRQQHKMNQQKFAEFVGLSQQTISRLESEKGKLTIGPLLKIAYKLDIGLEVSFVKLSDIDRIQKHISPKPYKQDAYLHQEATT